MNMHWIQKHKKGFVLALWLLLITAWGLAYYFDFCPTQVLSNHPCFIKELTGYSCISCGLTRMSEYLIHFSWKDAFLVNPFFFLLFVVSLISCVVMSVRVFLGKKALFVQPKIYWIPIFVGCGLAFTILRNTDFYLQYFIV